MFEPKRQSGGVVLCGGKSSRMGQPKHSLPIGDELLLQRVCRILAEIVSPIIVVAAVDQDLPPLPDSIRIVRDEFDSLGPLAGIATGLAALQADCDSAFVTSCDVPLLKPEFVRAIIEKLGSHDVAVPSDGKYDHVLAAAYRTNLGLTARELLTAGQRRPLRLIESSNSLRNANTQEEYEAILKLL